MTAFNIHVISSKESDKDVGRSGWSLEPIWYKGIISSIKYLCTWTFSTWQYKSE